MLTAFALDFLLIWYNGSANAESKPAYIVNPHAREPETSRGFRRQDSLFIQ